MGWIDQSILVKKREKTSGTNDTFSLLSKGWCWEGKLGIKNCWIDTLPLTFVLLSSLPIVIFLVHEDSYRLFGCFHTVNLSLSVSLFRSFSEGGWGRMMQYTSGSKQSFVRSFVRSCFLLVCLVAKGPHQHKKTVKISQSIVLHSCHEVFLSYDVSFKNQT